MKLQHFIRSQRGRADNGLRHHDMQRDLWILAPESAHQVTGLMGDRADPEDLAVGFRRDCDCIQRASTFISSNDVPR